MSELAIIDQPQPHNSLAVQMDYARAVSVASMLPDNYRNKPADIMLAVGLGQSMGLSPAESLYRISVIKGKPTASAELIAANVRKAGHRLRVRGDDQSCTATIIRADDPDYEFTVTRDIKWAQGMGLAEQPNYRKQPGTMLQWRAITAVARLACPEALYGVAYTSDEIEAGEQPRTGGLAAAMGVTVEQVEDEPEPDEPLDAPVTARTRKQMFALFGEKGVPDDEQLPGINHITQADYTSRADITEAHALQVIEVLKAKPAPASTQAPA